MQLLGIADALVVARSARQRGHGTVIAAVVRNQSESSISVGSRLVVDSAGSVVGRINPALDPLLVEIAKRLLRERRSRFRSFQLDRERAEEAPTQRGNVDVFFEVISPAPRLVIVGAGHIAVPLARMGKLLEFDVEVLDDRSEYATRERFPDAKALLVGPYRETLASVALDDDTYVVLVTRGHVHDQACLEEILDGPAAYIGMIGSRRRVQTVMAHAKEAGHDPELLKRVHAPVGLDINAHTPAEIALSIMAEIVNVRRGGRAPSMAMGKRLRV